jgi:hypothetical protein
MKSPSLMFSSSLPHVHVSLLPMHLSSFTHHAHPSFFFPSSHALPLRCVLASPLSFHTCTYTFLHVHVSPPIRTSILSCTFPSIHLSYHSCPLIYATSLSPLADYTCELHAHHSFKPMHILSFLHSIHAYCLPIPIFSIHLPKFMCISFHTPYFSACILHSCAIPSPTILFHSTPL